MIRFFRHGLFLLFMVSCMPGFAQLGFDLGFRTGPVQSRSFTQFADSFNKANGPAMKKEVGNLGMSYGWATGVDIAVSGFYGALRFSHVTASEKAEYNSGGKRHFDFSQFMTTVSCGVGVHEEEFAFNIGVGLAGGTDRIQTYYEYADGTKSFGADKFMNGIYEGLHFSYVANLSFAVGIAEGLMLYTHVDYIFGKGKLFESQLYENHYDRHLDSWNPVPAGLPLDYEQWLIDGPNFEYPVDNYVKTDFNGLRIELGIRYQLNFL